MVKKVLSFGLLALMVAVISGCGQQVPEVKSVSAAPQNIVAKGIVYSQTYVLGSSYYESQKGQPVSGAVVTLTGTYKTMSAVTNTAGEYVFQNIPYGNYTGLITKEGYQNTLFYIYQSGGMFAAAVEGEIQTFDVNLSTHPVIKSITATPNSTIETSATFTVVFNEPMDTSTVRPTIDPAGLRSFAAGDTVNLTTAWSSNDTVLVITPTSALHPNLNYQLSLASAFENIKDKAGNILAVGDISSYYRVPVFEPGAYINPSSSSPVNYISYKTVSNGVPGAPSNLSVIVNNKPLTSTGADYSDIHNGAGGRIVNLSWTPGTGLITGYKIYAADSSSGNYSLVDTAASNADNPTITNILSALYGAGASSFDPVGTGNWPMINKTLYLRVVAYNGDGESASAEVSAIDLNPPGLSTTVFSGRTGGVGFTAQYLGNGYYLAGLTAGTDKRVAYIAFDEPIDRSTITTGNFTLSAGAVTNVELLTTSSGDLDPGTVWAGSVYSIVKVTSDTDLVATVTVNIGTGVKDLAGNAIPAATTVAIP